jgi:hypothetical protein
MSDLPWYKDGLRFGCTECGKCCTGSPGFVWVSVEEMHAMAAFLRITFAEFVKRYTRQVGASYSLLEHSKNYDCVFLKNGKCSVYAARPKQCRTFPWWEENLKSPEHWQEAAERCEGINREDAPLISLEEIKQNLD